MAKQRNPYQSSRLTYRAVEDTPEDMVLIKSMQNDAWAYGNSNFTLMRPQGAHDLQRAKAGITDQALSASSFASQRRRRSEYSITPARRQSGYRTEPAASRSGTPS